MSRIKSLIMEIEEFCDWYMYGGYSESTVEEVSEDAEKFFGTMMAGQYAKKYIERTLRDK
jgi:hypothetical protein